MKKRLFLLLLVAIVLLGLVLRTWNLTAFAGLDFDQETAAFWIRDFIVNHKLSLIGQEVSVGGGFLAPFYFYLLAVFYLLFRFHPIAGNVMVTFFALCTIIQVFNLGRVLWGKKTGLLGAFLYACSWQINFYDRTTAPSNLVMLFSVTIAGLTLGALDRKKLLFLAILFSLAFSVHPTILFLIPAVFVLMWPKRHQIKVLDLGVALAAFVLLILPLIIFELRHGFVGMDNLLTGSLFSGFSRQSYPFIFKLIINLRTILVALTGVIFPTANSAVMALGFVLVIGALIKLSSFGDKPRLFWGWLVSPVVILSIYSRNVPEYYFLIIFPLFLVFFARFLLEIKGPKRLMSIAILVLFLILNLNALGRHSNPVGMQNKMAAVSYIAQSSTGRTIKLDYFTDPGQQFGFNYLSWYYHLTLSPEGQIRYIIVVPKELSFESGSEFGGIKVLRDDKYMPILR